MAARALSPCLQLWTPVHGSCCHTIAGYINVMCPGCAASIRLVQGGKIRGGLMVSVQELDQPSGPPALVHPCQGCKCKVGLGGRS